MSTACRHVLRVAEDVLIAEWLCWLCAESVLSVSEPRWLAGCIGFVWVHADSFLRCVSSPFHSFVTTYGRVVMAGWLHGISASVFTSCVLVSRCGFTLSWFINQ